MNHTRGGVSLGAWLLIAGSIYAFLWPAVANLALPDGGGSTAGLLQALVVSRHLDLPWNTPGTQLGDSSLPGIGSAFWLSPFYCLGHLVSAVGGWWPPDGKNPLYRLCLALGTSLALLLAHMVLARLLVRRGWSAAGAVGLVTTWALAGPVGWHATFGAGDPHAISFLLATALVVLWMTGSDDLLLMASLVAALALVHPPDVLFALLLLPALGRASRRSIACTFFMLVLVIAPQGVVWWFWPASRPVFHLTVSGLLRALHSPAGGVLGAYPVMAVALLGMFIPLRLDANTCLAAAILTGNLLWIAATPRTCVAPVDPRWLSAGPLLVLGLAHLVENLRALGARLLPMVLMAVLAIFGLASTLAASWAAHGTSVAPIGALAALGASGTDPRRALELALRPGDAFQPAWMALHQFPYWLLAIVGFILVGSLVRLALIRPATAPIVVFLGAELLLGCALFSQALRSRGEHPLVFHGGEALLDGVDRRFSYFPRSTNTTSVLTLLVQLEGIQNSSDGEDLAHVTVRDTAGRELETSLAAAYDLAHVTLAQGPHGEDLHRRLMQVVIGRYVPGSLLSPSLDFGLAYQKTYHLPAASQISEIRIKKMLPHGRMRILGVWLYH
jgi:hypothetical protein